MKRRNIFRLVQDDFSYDTIEAVERLHEDARSGKLIGLAFVGIYRGQEYICNVAGFAYEQNTTAMSMVRMLSVRMEAKEQGL